jgi:GNAT superfamily N-acetyltransferase
MARRASLPRSCCLVVVAAVTATSSTASAFSLRSPIHPSSPTTTLTVAPTAWEFRQAGDQDVLVVSDLLEKKCAFDRALSGEPPSTIKPATGTSLVSLFPELGASGKVLLVNDKLKSDEDPVGFAMFQLRYYGLDAPPSLWLEDIFVDGAQRSQGAGLAMMHELARVSRRNYCSHLSWKCHVDNGKGNSFYGRMGATVQSQKGDMFNYHWVVPASVA